MLLEEEVKRRRMSRLCMYKAHAPQIIERNKENSSIQRPPSLPPVEEGVSSEEYLRLHRGLQLSTLFMKYSLLESGACIRTDKAVLQHNDMELTTLRRTQAVLAANWTNCNECAQFMRANTLGIFGRKLRP